MDNLKWDTDFKTLKRKDQREIVSLIMGWCTNVLCMRPRFGKTPKFKISERLKTGSRGEYDLNNHTITIYSKEIENLRRLVDIVIHEFTHSCQKFIHIRYAASLIKHGYKDSPFEVEARTIAKTNRTECLKWLIKEYN